MRIFDPKNQFGSSLLSSADTQKSSVKLEKQMAVGGGAITLTSTDISDIENWELSNARVKVDGQMISFLPDTSRDGDGNLVITLGETFSDVVLVLKRTVFDGMKQEEEEITIEVKIQRLMAKTLATAGKDGYDADENIKEWKKLGDEAYDSDSVKYRAAEITHWNSENPPFALGATVEESFLSLQTTSLYAFAGNDGPKEWYSDLPCLQYIDNSPFIAGPIEVFEADMPNLVDGGSMFQDCTHLTSFSSEMPSLTNCVGMFYCCSGLESWTVELSNSITKANMMFASCTNLTSFQSDMPSGLTTNAEYMFSGCKLDITSVERISRTIAKCTGTHETYKTIHLGVSSECHGDTNYNEYINRMIDKGWIVVCDVNGSEHTHQHS